MGDNVGVRVTSGLGVGVPVGGNVGVTEGAGVSVPMRMEGSGKAVGSGPELQPESRNAAAITVINNLGINRISFNNGRIVLFY